MTRIKVARINESDDDDPYSIPSQCDATNEHNLDMYPGTLTFRNRGVEKDYLSDVAKQRWPVLLFIFCFDLICYIFRVAAKGVKLSATMSSASTCSQVFWEFAPQFGNMLLLYSFIGLLNRRSSRSGSAAAHQEESMISGLMSMAICSLLVSLTPDNASDYVYVAFFLICTSTFLKIRWWVGSAILIAPVVLVQMWQGSKNLPPDATVHIVVAWGVGALMTYLAEWYRRQTFANQKVAAIAMQKEVREAQARVKVQKELAEAQAQAAQRALVVAQEKAANDAKSEFMSLMCHEVRTPLNGCLASAEMLLETPLAEEQRELANTIRVSGSILLSTVSNFLDYFKMEAGKQLDIVRQPVQLQEVVADVHRIIEAMLGNNCGVTLQTPDTRWVPQVIYVDPDRLRGILLNLYTNAAKFTKQGYIHLRVRTVPHSSEPKVPDGYYSVRVTPSYSPDPRRSSSSSSRPPSLDPFGTYNTSSQPTSSSNRGFSMRDPSPTDSSPLTHSSASAATTPDHKHTRLRQLKAEFLEQTGRLVSGRTLRASLDSSSPCVSSKRSGAETNTFRFGRKSCSSYGTSSIGGFGGIGMNSSTSDDLNIPTEHSTGENNYMFDDDDTGNWLLFEVIDTGVGIAENELQALFKEFVQGTEAAMRKPRSRGGTGLGLSICAKQVSLLGGKIGAHSKLGSGSVFWFIIPERWGLPMTSRHRSHNNMIPSSDGAYRPRWSLDLHELNQQCLSPSQRLDQYRTRERGRAERVSEKGGEVFVGVENDDRREGGSYGELSETARQVAEAAEDLGEHSWRAEREKRMAQYVYDNELVADHDSRLQDQQPGPAGRYSGNMAQQQAGVADGREYVVGDQPGLNPAVGSVSTSEIRLSESGAVDAQSGVSGNGLLHASDSVNGVPPTRGVSSGELSRSSHEGGRHATSKARSSASFEEVLSAPSSTGRQSADHTSSATPPEHTTSTQLSLAPSNSRRSLNRERRSMQLATITESARGERGSFDSSKEPSVDLAVPSKPVPPAVHTTKPASTEDGKTAEEAAGKVPAESAGPDPHHQKSVPTIWISTTCSVGNQPGTMPVAPTATTQPPAPPAITVVNNFSMHILSLLDNAALRTQISDQEMPGSITSVDPTLSSSAISSSDPSISSPPTPSHTVTTTTTATFGSSNTSIQSSTPTFRSTHPQSTSHSPSQATNIPPGTVAWQIVNNTRAETISVAPSVSPQEDATPTSPPISIPTSTTAPAPITSSSLTSEPSLRAASPLSSGISPDASPLASSPVSDNSSQIRKASANVMRRSTSNPIINSLTKNVRNSTERTRGCHSMDVSRRSILGDGQGMVSGGGLDGKGIGNTMGSGPGSRASEKGRRSATFPAGSSGRLVGFMGEKTASRLSQSTAGGAGQSQSLRMSLAGRPDLSMLVGRRALLVEDNLINQTVARKMLTSLGMVCEVASNGKEAIQAVEDALAKSAAVDVGDGNYVMFDVVLMDMAMPVMGGVEATRAIRSMGVTVPIVAMTANASEKDRDECRGAGMDGFLSKPVLKDRLGEAIIRVMHGQDCFNERSSRKHSFSA